MNSKVKSANCQTFVTAVIHISNDAVCCEHTGVKSAGARQVGLNNCARSNRDLGFGTPPACGDGAPRQTSKPRCPTVATYSNKPMALPIHINSNFNSNSITQILKSINDNFLSPWGPEAMSVTCASGHPVPLVRARLSLAFLAVDAGLLVTVSSLCTPLFMTTRTTGERSRAWLLKRGLILAGSLFMVALSSLISRSFTTMP
jgi:hypothetical protein